MKSIHDNGATIFDGILYYLFVLLGIGLIVAGMLGTLLLIGWALRWLLGL